MKINPLSGCLFVTPILSSAQAYAGCSSTASDRMIPVLAHNQAIKNDLLSSEGAVESSAAPGARSNVGD
jgi:hypothetical protein